MRRRDLFHPRRLASAAAQVLGIVDELRSVPGEPEPAAPEAALLRFSLDSNQALTPLRREIKIVTDYLEIERARFGDRLKYSIDIPEALLDAGVPPMSIQTLVENCVKHAISPRREGGSIEISAHDSGGQIEIAVADDGPGFTEEGFAEGHGLETLQSRLAAHFGDRAQLTVARRDGRTNASAGRVLRRQRMRNCMREFKTRSAPSSRSGLQAPEKHSATFFRRGTGAPTVESQFI